MKIAYCYLEEPTNLYDEPLQDSPVEQHGDQETEEVHSRQGLEHHNGADGVAGVDCLGDFIFNCPIFQLLQDEGLLIDKIAKHKTGAGVSEC